METCPPVGSESSPLASVAAPASGVSERAARRKAKKAAAKAEAKDTFGAAVAGAEATARRLARASSFIWEHMSMRPNHNRVELPNEPALQVPADLRPARLARVRAAVGLGCLNRPDADNAVFRIGSPGVAPLLGRLMRTYGRSAHVVLMDRSYNFFINDKQDAAICYQEKDGIAVVFGDPLCAGARYGEVLGEFKRFRAARGWGMAVIGGSQELADYGRKQGWGVARYGQEAVLNPQTNPVLAGTSGKSIINRNKQLLEKLQTKYHFYDQTKGRDPEIEKQLQGVYDGWRTSRNTSGAPQAYATVLDLFAVPGIMRYFYTTNKDGQANGLMALMEVGGENGFLIDPFIAAADAPNGITDLLVMSALKYVKDEGATFLSFGMGEPNAEMEDVANMNAVCKKALTTMHRAICQELKLGNKKEFHTKWKPDEAQARPLYLMFSGGNPGPAQGKAILDATHIRLKDVANGLRHLGRKKASR